MTDTQERYTEQEVALVLRRAAELEERRNLAPPARGLSRTELEEIARDVGFSSEVISQAITEMRGRSAATGLALFGPSGVHRQVRAVSGRLSTRALQQLVQTVEESNIGTGTVNEALGAVRWTTVSGHRFQPVTQVILTPGEAETYVQVTLRHRPHVRRLAHLLPAMWGGMVGFVAAASAAFSVGPGTLAVLAGMAAGGTLGGLAWRGVARASQRQVEKLVDGLAARARDAMPRDTEPS